MLAISRALIGASVIWKGARMSPARSVAIFLILAMMLGTGLSGVAGQEATPSAGNAAEAPNAGAPLPG